MNHMIRRDGGFVRISEIVKPSIDWSLPSSRETNKLQRKIYRLFGRERIVYHPRIARKLKSVKAAILLAQLLYWHERGAKKNRIYKSVEELYKETALSRKEQKTAIKVLQKFKILKITVEGMPPTRHFWLDIDAVTRLLISEPEVANKV